MILISLIKVNLIKEGTAGKNKSKKAGEQGSQREGFVTREAALLQGMEGSSGLSYFICLAPGHPGCPS